MYQHKKQLLPPQRESTEGHVHTLVQKFVSQSLTLTLSLSLSLSLTLALTLALTLTCRVDHLKSGSSAKRA